MLSRALRTVVFVLTLSGLSCRTAAQSLSPTPVIHRLEACIYDRLTQQLIPNAEMAMVGVGHGLEVYHQLDTGCVHSALPDARHISIRVSAPSHMVIHDQIDLDTNSVSTVFVKEYYLDPAKVIVDGPPIVRFPVNSASFTNATDSMLHEVYLMMIDNPTMVIEVRGHADAFEDSTISETRSHVVRDYLVAHGIRRQRVKSVAMGASEQLITSMELNRMSGEEEREMARSLNRRVEFKVIGFDAED